MNATNDFLQKATFLSEISPLSYEKLNLFRFRLAPHIKETELGNRLSFCLCRKFSEIIVVFNQGDFWAIAKPNQSIPNVAEWRASLETVQSEIKELSDRQFSVQLVNLSVPEPDVLAQLAYQILKIARPFPRASFTKRLQVVRKVDFWTETIEINDLIQPALSLGVKSEILFRGTLAEFLQSHPQRQDVKKLLIGIKVQDIETGGDGEIVEIAGTMRDHRERLIQFATGAISKQALIDAPDDQPVVSIKFGKSKKLYEYALAALRPRLTEDTSDRFEVKYSEISKQTKIPYKERMELLKRNKQIATEKLQEYGLQLSLRSVNSQDLVNLFWLPSVPVEKTPLLFGREFKGLRGQVLTGLTRGGVYRRHSDFHSKPINIVALKVCEEKVGKFLGDVTDRIKKYGFENQVVDKKEISVDGLEAEIARVELEKTLNQIANLPVDIVLVFLPESDRFADKEEGGSLYQLAYSHLLRRRIASQVIYADTLQKDRSQILNQVIPGVLAKLGNLPFILAEPLEIADYFIGLDISRASKAKLIGTMNACASVRLYNKQGEFIRYKLEDSLLEGEEIPQRLLEKLLPAAELENKTILIYRDGRFCGQEVSHLVKRANAISANFILVECRKSGVPRLYGLKEKSLDSPEIGLALRLSSHEAILVTTKVTESVGLARPIRLTVRTEGYPASIESVVETTLKLTLLHHGALKAPRLPMPIYGADRMAYLRLNGIYPSVLEGDRQFWL